MDGLDQLRVTFPASSGFGRIGRVAVAGLALRLGYDVTLVERLRLAVDAAVAELAGPGRITLVAAWDQGALSVQLSNPEAGLDEVSRTRARRSLAELVGEPQVESTALRLVIPAG